MQVNKEIWTRLNAIEIITSSILRDIMTFNSPIFLCSKVGEEPQAFLDKVYKIVHAISATSREKGD